MLRTALGFVRTTLVGGAMFLLPLLLIAFILRTGFVWAGKLSKPVIGWFPVLLGDRVAVADIVAIVLLFTIAFAAGLIARTLPGQRTMRWFENSLLGSLPQFHFARGIAESLSENQKVAVVLVPTDAGWNLGFIFEPGPGPWQAVFVPGAPEWTSGAVAWAHADNIRAADLTFTQAILTLRKLGAGSAKVSAALAVTA